MKGIGPDVSSRRCESALNLSPNPQLLLASSSSWLRQAWSPSSCSGCCTPPPWCQQKGRARDFEGVPTTSSKRQSEKEHNHCCRRWCQAQQGVWGRGQLGWKGGGGEQDGRRGEWRSPTTRTTTTMHNNYINIQYYIICLFLCNSCRAAEATKWQANPWNIDMIFMD